MEFPHRASTHMAETKSLEILGSCLPTEWVVRQLTERDYGVDFYVEIVGTDKRVTGDLIAIQVKGKQKIDLAANGSHTFSGIKRRTLNYWLALPVPVFFVAVCLTTKVAYWANVRELNRKGVFKGKSKSVSLILDRNNVFSTETGLLLFTIHYMREKRWRDVETAMVNSLMMYNALGPLVLFCKRQPDHFCCSTTIQFLTIQYYEYYCLLGRYLLLLKPDPLPIWYEKHMENVRNGLHQPSLTFSFKLIKEMLASFVFKYRDAIEVAYRLVLQDHRDYFSHQREFVYLQAHLSHKPLFFNLDDWAARYYYDEYESETQDIERKFFQDFRPPF